VALLATAQQSTDGDNWKQTWFNQHFSIELPVMIGYDAHHNFGANAPNNQASATVLNKAYWEGGFAAFGLGVQSQGRLLGFAWKDKLGLEVGICMYRKQIDFDRYYTQFASTHPDYYVAGIQPWDKSYGMNNNTADLQFFSGLNWGIYYNWPVGRFILQPHINVCFANWYLPGASSYYTQSTYKQHGTNNTLESHISTALTPDKGGYFLQLWAIRRAENGGDFFIKHVKGEFAFRIQAGLIPYSYRDTIITKEPNLQPVGQIVSGSATQFYLNFGVLLTGGRFINK
jgi:hypothetical protein